MKSQSAIRSHLADLRILRQVALQLPPGGHEQQCFLGKKMMQAVICILEWLLDETDDHDALIAACHQHAQEERCGLN